MHNPGDYTGTSSTPDVATGRSIPGAASAAANNIAPRTTRCFAPTTASASPTALAQGEESGSIWGIAWEPATETIFAAAVVKRHSGLLAGGPDAIYAYGAERAGGLGDAVHVGRHRRRRRGERRHPRPRQRLRAERRRRRVRAGRHARLGRPRHLRGRPHAVRRQPAGQDGPADRRSPPRPPALPITIPTPACTNGAARPWGLEVNDGLIYAGVVCDAATGTAADLAAFVYAYNPTAVTLPRCAVFRPASPPERGAATSSAGPPPASRSTTRRVARSAPTAASGTRGSSRT